jgi:hypothetical protein
LRTVAWAEVLEENTSDTQDRDDYGNYRGYCVTAAVVSLSVHLPILLVHSP